MHTNCIKRMALIREIACMFDDKSQRIETHWGEGGLEKSHCMPEVIKLGEGKKTLHSNTFHDVDMMQRHAVSGHA